MLLPQHAVHDIPISSYLPENVRLANGTTLISLKEPKQDYGGLLPGAGFWGVAACGED
jgi:hypothetical protein